MHAEKLQTYFVLNTLKLKRIIYKYFFLKSLVLFNFHHWNSLHPNITTTYTLKHIHISVKTTPVGHPKLDSNN